MAQLVYKAERKAPRSGSRRAPSVSSEPVVQDAPASETVSDDEAARSTGVGPESFPGPTSPSRGLASFPSNEPPVFSGRVSDLNRKELTHDYRFPAIGHQDASTAGHGDFNVGPPRTSIGEFVQSSNASWTVPRRQVRGADFVITEIRPSTYTQRRMGHEIRAAPGRK